MNSLQARPAIEIAVEAQNRLDTVVLHNGDVHGIACRHQSAILDDLPGTQNLCLSDGDHFVDDVQGYLKRRPDGLSLINGRIPIAPRQSGIPG